MKKKQSINNNYNQYKIDGNNPLPNIYFPSPNPSYISPNYSYIRFST